MVLVGRQAGIVGAERCLSATVEEIFQDPSLRLRGPFTSPGQYLSNVYIQLTAVTVEVCIGGFAAEVADVEGGWNVSRQRRKMCQKEQ